MSKKTYTDFIAFSKFIISVYELALEYDYDKKVLENILNVTRMTMKTYTSDSGKYFNLDKRTYQEQKARILYTEKAICNIDPKYKSPGRCFIATAVYGSYDAPEVLILRRFRDIYLDTKYLGRLFIKAYYRLSPPIANWIKNKNRLKRYSKLLLNKIVYSNFVNLKISRE
jgi:hypothetical protein